MFEIIPEQELPINNKSESVHKTSDASSGNESGLHKTSDASSGNESGLFSGKNGIFKKNIFKKDYLIINDNNFQHQAQFQEKHCLAKLSL